MGDVFHQTNAQQTANNQQVAFQTGDLSGSNVITVGAGTNLNAPISVQSLDPAALNLAAQTIHDSIAGNTATSVSAFQAYQTALAASGETAIGAEQLAAAGVASGGVVSPQSTLSLSQLNPSTVIWIGLAALAVVFAIGMMRK